MKKILDEFAKLPVSHQRKSQMRNAKRGVCEICGKPAVTRTHCLKHAVAQRERARKRIKASRRNHSFTYFLEAYDNGGKK